MCVNWFFEMAPVKTLYCTGNPIYIFPRNETYKLKLCRNETVQPRSQLLHSCICEQFIYSQDQSAYLAADQSWEYTNSSQINEFGNWETEYYNSVLEITSQAVLFLEIHKSEPDIYIGFLPPCICSVHIFEQKI
jgi:hypothetical protein